VQSDHAFDAAQPEPMINIDQYMRPFWKTDTIVNETVLLYAENGHPATGTLLYEPSKILSVKSFDLQSEYKLNTDYKIQKNILTAITGSSITVIADTFFKPENLAWYNIQSKWIVVSYLHKEKWNAAVPVYKGALMPLMISKLKAKKPVVIASYGMSITKGMDASGFDSVAPYLPNYTDLFAYQLRRSYHYDDIKNYNAALPGATAEWGANFAADYINPIKPDLVILDFGMNDFWRYTPSEFRAYLDTMVKKIRIGNRHVEFLLISNMRFDPGYILDSDTNKITYLKNFNGYLEVMKEMQSKGVICFDMTTLSEQIYNRKKARDCIANPLHPNDYLVRWYAQGMSALFISNY
jgi:lysophospholipase L1-like esterase